MTNENKIVNAESKPPTPDSGTPVRRRFASTAIALVRLTGYAIALALSLQVLAIIFSFVHPILELASHFALHGLVVGSAILLAMMLQSPRSRLAMASLVIANIYLLFLVHPWTVYGRSASTGDSQFKNEVTVLSWNVLAVNRDFNDIDQLIEQVDADVVVLIETQPNLLQHLPFLVQNYPLSHKILNWGGNGICIFSKIPGTEFAVEPFNCNRQPAIVATLPAQSKSANSAIQLVGMHTLSPVPIRRTYWRDEQLAAFAAWSDQQVGPICICGDLNTTPWTRSFRLIEQAGFIDSRLGVGNLPSWPSALGAFGIPIDHALTKGNCRITDRAVLPAVPGSDHRPIAFTLHY